MTDEIHIEVGAAVSFLVWKLSKRPDFPAVRLENLLHFEYILYAAFLFYPFSATHARNNIDEGTWF